MTKERGNDAERVVVRPLRASDDADVRKLLAQAHPGMGGAWLGGELAALREAFPEGQLGVEDRGKVVAASLAVMADAAALVGGRSLEEAADGRSFPRHVPEGDCLWGLGLVVHPDYRGRGLGRRLCGAAQELCERRNLQGILAAVPMPGRAAGASGPTPRQYIEGVRNGEIGDPALAFLLARDFHPKRVVGRPTPEGDSPGGAAVLIEWSNLSCEAPKQAIRGRKTSVRLGVVQWQMRPLPSVDDFLERAEFFVRTAAGYGSDLVVFPELFNAPLLARFPQDDPPAAMRALAAHTEPIRQELQRMAVAHGVNVVAGSLPEHDGARLGNVSYLCRRDGSWEGQHKLHVTPDEARWWGMQGGQSLRAFDTDVGRVGILVCYDVEFPELGRVLADQGMELLLVPYWTDTRNAYLRVRRCAQARAVENECYVALSGSTGTVAGVANVDVQYSQAAVFTPSDLAFPPDAVAAQATPNVETLLVADVDLELLTQLREQGSVRTLRDRRRDLYRVVWTLGEPR
jgi:predicted amidohydrolase/GNAT superfamily N-acetyltransferase